MHRRVAAALFLVTAACADSGEDLGALRANLGKNACNAVNGAFRGRIVDVIHYAAAGQASTPVYVVERQGRRTNAPPSNTTVVTGNCPDGQPGAPAR